jgi:5'(3')-deoxyribonucleotidase
MSATHGSNRLPKLFLDMDGVWADFEKARKASALPADEFKLLRHAYRHLDEMPGAKEGMDFLMTLPVEIFIATKIPTDNPYAATDKLLWVEERRPELLDHVIITPHKGLLGDKHDFLLDDRPYKAHCREFEGTLLTFGEEGRFPDWTAVRRYFEHRFLKDRFLAVR